jgi:hypothetical protein
MTSGRSDAAQEERRPLARRPEPIPQKKALNCSEACPVNPRMLVIAVQRGQAALAVDFAIWLAIASISAGDKQS